MSNQSATALNPQSETLEAGDVVENFGAVVRVVEVVNPTTVLVEIIPAIKGGETQGGVGQRYQASADKCYPVKRRVWGNVEILAGGNGTRFYLRNGHVYRASCDAVVMPDGVPGCGRWECSFAHWKRFRLNWSWAAEVVAA